MDVKNCECGGLPYFIFCRGKWVWRLECGKCHKYKYVDPPYGKETLEKNVNKELIIIWNIDNKEDKNMPTEKCNTCNKFPSFDFIDVSRPGETYTVNCECGFGNKLPFPVSYLTDVIYGWNKMCKDEKENEIITQEKALKEWAALRCMFWVHENEIPSEFFVVEKYIKQGINQENKND